MDVQLFYPAPAGFPQPVQPRAAERRILEQLQRYRWELVVARRGAVRAGAYWLYGFIEQAHAIAQEDHSAEGSYWHALVHRSDADFGNSLYWFHRVDEHPIFSDLREEVGRIVQSGTGNCGGLLDLPRWEPRRLVDLCRAAHEGRSDDLEFLQKVAAAEYNLLMGYCLKAER